MRDPKRIWRGSFVLTLFCQSFLLGILVGCGESSKTADSLPDASALQTVSDSEGLLTFGQTEPREINDEQTRAALRVRGEYLVKAVAACGACHGTDSRNPNSPLSGGKAMQDRFGAVNAANITPDVETGIGSWGMADVMRAIRASIAKDGAALSVDMHSNYRWMSDADTRAIAVYLLSQKPVSSPVERRELGQFERRSWGVFSQHRDFRGYVPSLPEQQSANWGRYISHYVAGCYSCHTAEGGTSSDSEAFAGGEGGKRGLLGAVKGLYSLLKGEVSEARRKDKENTIRSLLSTEGNKSVYGEPPPRTSVKQKLKPSTVSWQGTEKAEFDEALNEGVYPIAGPDIRGSSQAGIAGWSEADIVRYLSSGETPSSGKTDARACPWPYFARMSRSDKLAIAKFLKSL